MEGAARQLSHPRIALLSGALGVKWDPLLESLPSASMLCPDVQAVLSRQPHGPNGILPRSVPIRRAEEVDCQLQVFSRLWVARMIPRHKDIVAICGNESERRCSPIIIAGQVAGVGIAGGESRGRVCCNCCNSPKAVEVPLQRSTWLGNIHADCKVGQVDLSPAAWFDSPPKRLLIPACAHNLSKNFKLLVQRLHCP